MQKQTYVLTDGMTIYDEREMDDIEADNANDDSKMATDGNLSWELKNCQNNMTDTKKPATFVPADIRKVLEQAYTEMFPQNPDEIDLDEAGERIRDAISMTHNLELDESGSGRAAPGPWEKQFEELDGQLKSADAMASMMEKLLSWVPGYGADANNAGAYYSYLAVVSVGRGPETFNRMITVSAPSIIWAIRAVNDSIPKVDARIISIEKVD